MKYLPFIERPADLKNLSVEALEELADEIRQELVSTVSHTGGHLATNLGSVELTIALHYVFNLPADKFVWDVGHQVYPHKLLTGRRDRFSTIRQYEGLSGFSKQAESEYDCYGAGHASTSISAALGFAAARDRAKEDHKVVAIIGGSLKTDILVVLNDNHWSISKNVGALSKYLTGIMADETFNRLRDEVWELTGRFKRRDKIRETIAHIEHSLKGLLVPGMLFQKLGFRYFGPIDGHDLGLTIRTLESLKNLRGPILLHVGTKKGKGFQPAEGDPTKFHGIGKFDKVTGAPEVKKPGLPSYTNVYGDTLVELAEKDDRVVAITAAMTTGTGLVGYAEKFPDRFYDVGIAEGHAGCFASGLAAGGSRPYLTVYSTFMQRATDQVIHDMALQKLPVVIGMDRAGIVGADGPTHHGLFDLSLFASVPNVTVVAPKDGNELRSVLHYTIDNEIEGPVLIRYPRASVPVEMKTEISSIAWGEWEELTPPAPHVILAVGTMVETAREVALKLKDQGIMAQVVNARFVKPMDEAILDNIRCRAKSIITFEENQLRGGFGEAALAWLAQHGFSGKTMSFGIGDEFVNHGDRGKLLKDVGLDADSVTRSIVERLSDTGTTKIAESIVARRTEKPNVVSAKPSLGESSGG